ncbi:MAG: hypothetical protein ACT6R2_17640 [Blastomonas fulva]|jgi:hypothetical protein|uniref:Uncharacterized protein n=1 Tax=Blastomonas fulva TaxID=1550728 RepID=A0ABM6M5X6_9SPHN|nr:MULTISPECIES: hypothetical protein [Blastomonas]AOG01936.1 hypothetical protein BSY18_3176 [Blastomonas sp. RAC04]ASR51206.1 hypothetical protein B5J99_06775 [Blastomonas fulva]KPF73531.1 hypothetical protein IP68_16035 [Blastomonas sp. AAP25]MCO5791277.1 hypothetical protein [Blastomonas sp.]MDK2756840.1 hypothetical protein [Blastomonas fulva]
MQDPAASDSTEDRLKLARQQLRMQAGHVRAIAWRVSRAELAVQIDRMRRIADSNAMPCVSDLAHGLEHLLANGWSRTMARHYFDAMDEAIASDCGNADMRAAVLASIAVRGAR